MANWKSRKKQLDRLQEENTGTISDKNKTNNQILPQKKRTPIPMSLANDHNH